MATEEYDTQADKLIDNMMSQKDSGLRVRGSVTVDGQELTGDINHMDRSGANRVELGFIAAPGISVIWHGRRIQAVVEDIAPDIAQISDEKTPLRLMTICD